MGIKHVFVSAKSDSSDTSLVRPTNWNDDHTIDGTVSPATDDGAALGTTTGPFRWSDLFLADGGVINWGSGGVTVTHTAASDSLAIALDAGNGLASTAFSVALDGVTALTLDGGYAVFDCGAVSYPGLEVKGSATGSGGPQIYTYHDSASPAASDDVGSLIFFGRDSAANTYQLYGSVNAIISDPTSGSEDGFMTFNVVSGGSNVTRLRIDGDGLKFNGDTAAANALDNYEEGTWTPQLTANGTNFDSVGYSVQQGTYTKVGSHITATFVLTLNALTVGSASGGCRLTGLPFAQASTGSGSVNISYDANFTTDAPDWGYVANSATYADLFYRNGGSSAAVSYANVNSNSIIWGTVLYRVT